MNFTSFISCKELKNQFENDKRRIDMIKTEMPTLNATLGGGLRTSEFILFSGMQGKGKTTFLLREAIQGLNQGKKVAYICFEEEPIMIQTRLACYISRTRYTSHLIEEYPIECQEKIKNAMDGLDGLQIVYFYDYYKEFCDLIDNYKEFRDSGLEKKQPDALLFLIEQLAHDGYNFIFLDYLAKIRGNIDANSNTNDFYGMIAEDLKVKVDRLNICLISSMQLNRGVYGKLKEKKLDFSEIDNEYIQKSIDVGANVTQGISFFPDPRDKEKRIFNVYKNRLNGKECVFETMISLDETKPFYTRQEVNLEEYVDKKNDMLEKYKE